MADIEWQQANYLPGNSFPRSIPPWRQNNILHDARVSLEYRCMLLTGAHLPMCGAL